MFCQKFDLIDEACNNFSLDTCKGCEHIVYEDGFMSCELIISKIIGSNGGEIKNE